MSAKFCDYNSMKNIKFLHFHYITIVFYLKKKQNCFVLSAHNVYRKKKKHGISFDPF